MGGRALGDIQKTAAKTGKIGDSYETWMTHTRSLSTDNVQFDRIFKAGEPPEAFVVVNRIEIN